MPTSSSTRCVGRGRLDGLEAERLSVPPMNLKLALSLVGLVALATGCAEVRASSRLQLSEQNSKVVIAGPQEDAARHLVDMFGKRGQMLTDRQKRGDATLYTFKGPRASVTTVSGGAFVTSSTNTVGSVYFALMKPQDGNTLVELFGKPTMDGKPVCSDEDPKWVPRCDAVITGLAWSGLEQMTGLDEAELIRSILLELDLGTSNAPGSVVVKAPEPEPGKPVEPTCVATELPEWKTASAVQKRDLLRKCAEPKPLAPTQSATPTP